MTTRSPPHGGFEIELSGGESIFPALTTSVTTFTMMKALSLIPVPNIRITLTSLSKAV